MIKETNIYRLQIEIYSPRATACRATRFFLVVADNIYEAQAKVRAYGEENTKWVPLDDKSARCGWDDVAIYGMQLSRSKRTKIIR